MTPITLRYRSALGLLSRLSRFAITHPQRAHGQPLPLSSHGCWRYSCPQPAFPTRSFSMTGIDADATIDKRQLQLKLWPVCSQYPRRRGRIIFEQTERKPAEEGQDTLERLEKAASAVTEADERFAKELGPDAASEPYLKLALSRLRPILLYSRYHPDTQFLKGYAPPGSSTDRARDATVYLFVSAQGWFSRAVAAAKSRSQNLDPEVVEAAVKFSKAVSIIETYVGDETPESLDWSEVGATILAVSRDAWTPMRNAIEGTSSGPSTNPEGIR